MSSRVVTNLKPEKDPSLKIDAGTFYVAGLSFNYNGDPSPQTVEIYKKYQRELLPLLRKECGERYPSLFVDDPASAIQLGVDVETTTTLHNGEMMAWMFCTLMITPMILPAPGDMDEDIDVKVGVWTGHEDLRSATLQKSFRREIHTWTTLLTPVGLITIPGESDFPKVSGGILNMQEMQKVYLQQLAPQIATAVAKIVVTKDAAYWTAQPRAPVYPSALPVSPGAAPATLPLPTETVAPF